MINFLRDKKFIILFYSCLFLLICFSPIQILAEGGNTMADYQNLPDLGGLVPCDGVTYECDIDAFIRMINGIIKWIISIAGVIFAISFIYGGFLYLTSQGDEGKKGKAKDVLWSTLKGFVIILVAWVIVYTLLNTLVNKDSLPDVLKFIGK